MPKKHKFEFDIPGSPFVSIEINDFLFSLNNTDRLKYYLSESHKRWFKINYLILDKTEHIVKGANIVKILPVPDHVNNKVINNGILSVNKEHTKSK